MRILGALGGGGREIIRSIISSQARLGLEGDSSVNDIGFVRRLAERDCKVLM